MACEPSDDELLALLDGELPPAREQAVREHLQACWSCRARYEELKATIAAFVDLVQGPVRLAIPEPPRRWAGFPSRLHAAADGRQAQQTQTGWAGLLLFGVTWARLRAASARRARRARAAVADRLAGATGRRVFISGLLAAVAMLFITLVPGSPRLSAQVILDQAAAAETSRFSEVPHPVTRQRFEAMRRVNGRVVERAQWDLYHDVRSGRTRATAAAARDLPPLATEIARMLDGRPGERGHPLSSADYGRWQRAHAGVSPDVTTVTLKDGRTGYRLHARAAGPVGAGEIAAMGLIVRADDWHAIGQELEVRTNAGHDEVQIAEIAFDVLRFDTLAAGIFVDPVPAPSHAAEALTPRGPSDAELNASEMTARYVLHGHGADRGEPIQILRGRTRVTVRGLVDSTTRAAELSAALAGIAYVQADFTALDRIAARGPRADSLASTPGTAVHIDGAPRPAPLQAVIDAFLTSTANGTSAADAPHDPAETETSRLSRRRNALVARTLAHADRAMAEAWALRRLADRYPLDALPPADRSRDRLEEMVRDHVRALIVSTSAWRSELSALAPFARARLASEAPASLAPRVGSSAGGTSDVWPAYATTLFRELVQAQSLTADGLLGSATDARPAEAAGASAGSTSATRIAERHLLDLLDSLAAVEQTLRRLDDSARLGRSLTGAGSSLPR